ncbi:hydrolase HAD superfamily domain protein, partial [Chlamydia psittaci 06-1683]
ELCSAADA